MALRLSSRQGRAWMGGRSKYNARKTTVDGLVFDSAAEARRWQQLEILGQLGQIRNLEFHPSWELYAVNLARHPQQFAMQRVGKYEADARYEERELIPCGRGGGSSPGVRWRDVVEDTKGVLTPVYRLKKKLMRAIYGIEIREVGARAR